MLISHFYMVINNIHRGSFYLAYCISALTEERLLLSCVMCRYFNVRFLHHRHLFNWLPDSLGQSH